MKKILLMISFLFFISAILSAEWVGFGGSEGQAPDIAVVEDRGSSITVALELEGYSLEDALINNTTYTRVLLPHEVTYLKAGFPELPTISRNIAIPDDAQMGYRIVEIEYESRKVHTVLPSKGNLYRNVDPEDVPYSFNAVYGQDGYWPAEVVELSEPFIIRDFRGLSLRFNPFQYNPVTGELRVVKRVVVEVYVIGKGKVNVLLPGERVINREFIGIYDHLFLNSPMSRYPSISEYAGRMVVICADSYMSNMGEFVSWKLQKGIETKIVTISSVGNNQTSIKNFIQTEYNAGGLVWVLLVGDGNQVVPATGTMGSASGADADPVYAYTSGSDYYPDIFVCRFSSRGTATNIDKQVSRSIYYEKTPETGADWYHVGLGVASSQGSPSDKVRCNWLRDSLLTFTYTSVDSSYDPWGSSSIIKSKIEAGTSIIDYIGHGSTTGWLNGGGFGISDINNLNNPWMLPFVLSVACVIGNFNGSDCYCEASVTAGTVAQPDGFVAHWGSSINQSWVPPCYGQEGAVNLLTHDSKNSFGGICFNGASYMIEHYGSTNSQGIEMAQTWHIFGDASLQLRTDTPQQMSVVHEVNVPIGPSPFTVTVTDGRAPVEDALVCAMKGSETWESGYTNASGEVILNISPASPGTLLVTVTAFNCIPYEGFALANSGPYCIYDGHSINDNAGGNGDGVVSAYEAISMPVTLKNIGIQSAKDVEGTLRFETTSSYVTLTDTFATFGDIMADSSKLGSPPYGFSVASNCPNGEVIEFEIQVTDSALNDWVHTFSETVWNPELSYEGQLLDDSGEWHPNGILNAGETVDITTSLKNWNGYAHATGVTAVLRINDAHIVVLDSVATFPDMSPDETVDNTSNPYVVEALSTLPFDYPVDVELYVTADNCVATFNYNFLAGERQGEDPTGPDDYAYWAYDMYDVLYTECPTYGWEEVDPNYGGSGTDLVLGDNETKQVVLPFTFKYYGTDYDTISVCSNGWIAFGITSDTDFRYYAPPDVMGPPAAVGVFWGSLDPSAAGGVYTYYDSGLHAFIVEWSRVDHENTAGEETFQVLLSDPAYNPTVTGDGEIFCQYLYVTYPDNSMTAIEDDSETLGLLYQISDTYAPGAAPLADAFVCKFTTDPPEPLGVAEEVTTLVLPKVYGLSQSYPNPCGSHAVINYQLPRKSGVSLRVYDVSGRLVDELVSGAIDAGYHSVRLDTKSYMSGVYFYRLVAGNRVFMKKMIVVK